MERLTAFILFSSSGEEDSLETGHQRGNGFVDFGHRQRTGRRISAGFRVERAFFEEAEGFDARLDFALSEVRLHAGVVPSYFEHDLVVGPVEGGAHNNEDRGTQVVGCEESRAVARDYGIALPMENGVRKFRGPFGKAAREVIDEAHERQIGNVSVRERADALAKDKPERCDRKLAPGKGKPEERFFAVPVGFKEELLFRHESGFVDGFSHRKADFLPQSGASRFQRNVARIAPKTQFFRKTPCLQPFFHHLREKRDIGKIALMLHILDISIVLQRDMRRTGGPVCRNIGLKIKGHGLGLRHGYKKRNPRIRRASAGRCGVSPLGG